MLYNDGDLCPNCGKTPLKKKVITETFEYKGEELEIPNYVIFECSLCDDSFVDGRFLNRLDKVLKEFHKTVDTLNG